MESGESTPPGKERPFSFVKEKRQTYNPNSVAVLVYRVAGRGGSLPYNPSLDTPADVKFNTTTEMVSSISRFFFGTEESTQFKGLNASDYSFIAKDFGVLTKKISALPHIRKPDNRVVVPENDAKQFVTDNISPEPLEDNESSNLLDMINGNPRAKLWFQKNAAAIILRELIERSSNEKSAQWLAKRLATILATKQYQNIKKIKDLTTIEFLKNNPEEAIRVMREALAFAKDSSI